MIDGEMQADVALIPGLREDWSFSDLKGAANVLIFPNLDAGNIAYKLLSAFGGAQAVGPILLGMRRPVTVLSRTAPSTPSSTWRPSPWRRAVGSRCFR